MIDTIETHERRGKGSKGWGRVFPILGLSLDPRPHKTWEEGPNLRPTKYQGSARLYEVSDEGEAIAWRTDANVFYAFVDGELAELEALELLDFHRPSVEDIWAEVRSQVQAGDHNAARAAAGWTEHLARLEDESRSTWSDRAHTTYTEMVAYIGEATRHTIEVVPRLTGSTRQVAWAETIRVEAIDWIAHVRADVDAAIEDGGWNDLEPERLGKRWMMFWGTELLLKQIEEVLYTETRAKRWIDAHPRGWSSRETWRTSVSPGALLEGRLVGIRKLVRAWANAPIPDTTDT